MVIFWHRKGPFVSETVDRSSFWHRKGRFVSETSKNRLSDTQRLFLCQKLSSRSSSGTKRAPLIPKRETSVAKEGPVVVDAGAGGGE